MASLYDQALENVKGQGIRDTMAEFARTQKGKPIGYIKPPMQTVVPQVEEQLLNSGIMTSPKLDQTPLSETDLYNATLSSGVPLPERDIYGTSDEITDAEMEGDLRESLGIDRNDETPATLETPQTSQVFEEKVAEVTASLDPLTRKMFQKNIADNDPIGAAQTVLKKKAQDVDKSDLSPEKKAEEKKKFEIFGGSPDTWLMDFGLAMMACDSPYFSQCFGQAGLTANKSVQEKQKAEREKRLLDIKETSAEAAMLKALKESTGDDNWESKTMSYKHPVTGEQTIGTLMLGTKENSGKGRLVELNGNILDVDMTTARSVGVTAENKDIVKEQMKLGQAIRERELGTVQFLGRATNQLEFVKADRTMPQSEFVREGYINLESAKESITSIAKDLGFMGLDKDLQAKLEKDPKYLDNLMTNYFGDPETMDAGMKSYIDRVGGWENFKAINLSMAIDLAASKGTTGRALSDKDMVNFLTQVGAQAKTREGYIAIVENLIKNTEDDFLLAKKDYNDTYMGDNAPGADYYQNYWQKKIGGDEFYKGRWGGSLYRRYQPKTAAPVTPAPTAKAPVWSGQAARTQ